MSASYGAGTVGLHVRVSNAAAKNLYVGEMGYVIRDVIGGYYQDGEDAYFMEKDFGKGKVNGGGRREVVVGMEKEGNGEDSPWRMVGGIVKEYWSSRKRKNGCIWQDGPMELRLPRKIPLLTQEEMDAQRENGGGGRGRRTSPLRSSLVTEMDGEDVIGVRSGGGGGNGVKVTEVEFEEREEEDDECQVMTGSL